MRRVILTIIAVFFAFEAMAGNPAPLFDKPVKLDDSGRPLYNTWERQEYERKLRQRRRQMKLKKQKQQKVQNQNSGNSAVSDPNASTAVTNRPSQIKGDVKQVDDVQNYDF